MVKHLVAILPDLGTIHVGSDLRFGVFEGEFYFPEAEFYLGVNDTARRALRIMCSEAARTIGLRYPVRIGAIGFREEVLFASMRGLRTQDDLANNLVYWLMETREIEYNMRVNMTQAQCAERRQEIVRQVDQELSKYRALAAEKELELALAKEAVRIQEEKNLQQKRMRSLREDVVNRLDAVAMLLPDYVCEQSTKVARDERLFRWSSLRRVSHVNCYVGQSLREQLQEQFDLIGEKDEEFLILMFEKFCMPGTFLQKQAVIENCWRRMFSVGHFVVIWPKRTAYDRFYDLDYNKWKRGLLSSFLDSVNEFKGIGNGFQFDGFDIGNLCPQIFFKVNVIERSTERSNPYELSGWSLGNPNTFESVVWPVTNLFLAVEQWPNRQLLDSMYYNSDCQIEVTVGCVKYYWYWGWVSDPPGMVHPYQYVKRLRELYGNKPISVSILSGCTCISGIVDSLYGSILVFRGKVDVGGFRIDQEEYVAFLTYNFPHVDNGTENVDRITGRFDLTEPGGNVRYNFYKPFKALDYY